MLPAGPVFARYFEFGAESVDFECGVAVTAPFPGDGEVQAGELGGGEAAVGLHIGPYDTLARDVRQLQAWIAARVGARPQHVGGLPDRPGGGARPGAWRTEVYWPVS